MTRKSRTASPKYSSLWKHKFRRSLRLVYGIPFIAVRQTIVHVGWVSKCSNQIGFVLEHILDLLFDVIKPFVGVELGDERPFLIAGLRTVRQENRRGRRHSIYPQRDLSVKAASMAYLLCSSMGMASKPSHFIMCLVVA